MSRPVPKQADPIGAGVALDENVMAGERSLPLNFAFTLLMVQTALPPGSEILSVVPSGQSLWVGTVKIEVKLKDGTSRALFKKVRFNSQ